MGLFAIVLFLQILGGAWYIANVLAELDTALEWHVDSKTDTIYFMPNHSRMPDTIIASQLPCLISLQGTIENPVTNINLLGLTFMHTASTYMRDYEVPRLEILLPPHIHSKRLIDNLLLSQTALISTC